MKENTKPGSSLFLRCLLAPLTILGKILRSNLTKAADVKQLTSPDLFMDQANAIPLPSTGLQTESADCNFDALESISLSLDLQLEMVRHSLHLTTVALLWPDQEGEKLLLRNISAGRDDIHTGPYDPGAGIIAALRKNLTEVTAHDVKVDFPGVPYYADSKGVGGIFAIRIQPLTPKSAERREPFGILCADRVSTEPWRDTDRKVFQLLAQKISLDLMLATKFHALGHEKNDLHRVYLGLRELNTALDLESVYNATIKAVSSVVAFDLIAINLLEGFSHKVVRAEGINSDRYQGLEFPKDEGLIGQVLKLNHWLPAGAEYNLPAPVFSNSILLTDFKSLLILPLRMEKGIPLGALTIAATEPGVFSGSRLELLELIADQVAIKIELAQSHERISKLATTDGLTGLANHRTFQHGLDIMLERTRRSKTSPICLIICDLDHFKLINDSYGHPFGDKVLQKVAQILAKSVRRLDLAARYGGEEFALVLEDSTEAGGRLLTERIRKEIENLSLRHDKKEVRLTMSFGLAIFPDDANEKSQLIIKADEALYHAKNTGRNRIVAYSELSPRQA